MKRFAAAALFVATSAALASPITYQFSGSITDVVDSYPEYGDGEGIEPWFPAIGQSFEGQIIWDHGPVRIRFQFGDTVVASYADASPLYADAIGNSLVLAANMGQSVATTFGAVVGTPDSFGPQLIFTGPVGNPASLPELPVDAFIGGTLRLVDNAFWDSFEGSITSLAVAPFAVPSPSTLALLSLSLAGLALARKRKCS